jgi:hypothetical protein
MIANKQNTAASVRIRREIVGISGRSQTFRGTGIPPVEGMTIVAMPQRHWILT